MWMVSFFFGLRLRLMTQSSSPRPLKEDKPIREIRHPAEPLYFAPESLQIPLVYISTSEAKRSALRGLKREFKIL